MMGDKRSSEPNRKAKPRPDSTGPNARPRDETIAQTGAGIPDDTSRPVDVDPDEAKKMEDRLRSPLKDK